jgi:hypothetical protein
MISKEQRDVLRVVYERLRDLNVPWAITGSVGFALHGMAVSVHDIDLQTDKAGAYRIQDLFRTEVRSTVQFAEGQSIRSYIGELKINEFKVEIMGALQKRLPSGEWEPQVDVLKHARIVKFDGMDLPVLSLEYEETAYRMLGRIEKADAFRRWLTRHSCGHGLLGPSH